MATTSYKIDVNLEGMIVKTQTTVMTPEEYLLEASQIYQYQVSMKGTPGRDELLKRLEQEGSDGGQ